MDITLLPPSQILTNHSHLTLLPSPFSPISRRSHLPTYTPSTHPHLSSSYRPPKRRSLPSPDPPMDGSCPLDLLPDELILHIFGFLSWEQIIHLRPVSRRFSHLALSPGVHRSLTLLSLPPTPVPPVLKKMLLSTRHLHLHLFPYPMSTPGGVHPTTALLSLLEALPPDQLISLSLPFSAPYLPGSELGEVLRRLGGKLEHLDLRGSGLIGSRWTEWIRDVGSKGHGLKTLDLSFTSIATLPLPPNIGPSVDGSSERTSHDLWTSPRRPLSQSRRRNPLIPASAIQDLNPLDPFRNLQSLSLSSCAYLPESVLTAFLATLPVTLEHLDVSRLECVTFEALWGMRVIHSDDPTVQYTPPRPISYLAGHSTWGMTDAMEAGDFKPTKLGEIKVVGIDHLTRRDVRHLKQHWEDQRRSCFPPPPVPDSPPMRYIPLPEDSWKTPSTPPRQTVPLSPPATPSPTDNLGLRLSPGRSSWPADLGPLAQTAIDSYSTPESILSPVGSPRPSYSPSDHRTPSPSKHQVHGGQAIPGDHTYATGLPTPPDEVSPFDECDCYEPKEDPLEAMVKINILHSAILESEDEDGYRRFIGEVAGGTVSLHGGQWASVHGH